MKQHIACGVYYMFKAMGWIIITLVVLGVLFLAGSFLTGLLGIFPDTGSIKDLFMILGAGFGGIALVVGVFVLYDWSSYNRKC